MMTGSLAAAAETMHGTLHGPDAEFRGVSTDTRTIDPGELFVALEGPNFDGKAFVGQAAKGRAAGAVVSRPVEADIATIVVDDTRQALGALGAAWRRQMPATVIGITGSNGKTTLKEMVASCLSMSGPTLATHGNLNNEIGLPLMLTRISAGHRYAVIEMGANHAGEIGYLASLASPYVAAITNAGPAHLEGFGSVEGVARAKGEIFGATECAAFAVLNADDDYFGYWKTLIRDAELLSFGLGAAADVRASRIEITASGAQFTLHMPGGPIDAEIHLQGRHNVLNACAAAAICVALEVPAEQIRAGLAAARPAAGRLQPVDGRSGVIVYDDSYNANPVSVQAAAEFLAAQDGRSWLVLGDMAELGGDAKLLHAHTGWVIREAGVDRLLGTGALSQHAVESFGDGAEWFESMDELVRYLAGAVGEGDVVLVKGSRSSGMERAVAALIDPPGEIG